jgi:hypothetical protein
VLPLIFDVVYNSENAYVLLMIAIPPSFVVIIV